MKKIIPLLTALSLLAGCNDDNKNNQVNVTPPVESPENEVWTYINPNIKVLVDEPLVIEINNNKIFSTPYNFYRTNEFVANLYLTFTENSEAGTFLENGSYNPPLPILTQDAAYQVQYNDEKKLHEFGTITEFTENSWTYKVPLMSQSEQESKLEITTTYSKRDLSQYSIKSLFFENAVAEDAPKFPQGSYCLYDISSVANERFMSIWRLYPVSFNGSQLFGDNTQITQNLGTNYRGFTNTQYITTLLPSYLSQGSAYITYPDLAHTYDSNTEGLKDDALIKQKQKCLYYNSKATKFIYENKQDLITSIP